MAVDSNALTMAQYALLSNEPAVQAVIKDLVSGGSILATDIPMVNQETLVMNGVRFSGGLPTVNWAKVNEEGTTVTAVPEPYQEQAYLIRNYVETDHVLLKEKNRITDPHAFRVDAVLEAIKCDTNDKFINNNHETGDKDAFVGIRSRLDNSSTYGINSANKMDAAATMTTAATAANFAGFLEKVEELLWNLGSPDGTGVKLYMNDTLMRRWSTLSRVFSGQGGFGQATDQLGRSVNVYKNAQLVEVGVKGDQTTRIITSTETTGGADGASTYTSLYGVRYGANGLIGWQYSPVRATAPELKENQTHVRSLIEWVGGITTPSKRAIGRLYNIKVA